MFDDVRSLLWDLAWVDPRAAVWCAAMCARTVSSYVRGAEGPAAAIEAAEAWARGEATEHDCARAFAAATTHTTSIIAALSPATAAGNAAAAAARAAGHAAFADTAAQVAANYAASFTSFAAVDYVTATDRRSAADAATLAARSAGHKAAEASANAAIYAAEAVAAAAADEANPDRARTRRLHLARLLVVVRKVRWPLTVPSPATLSAASPAVRAAWDVVAPGGGEDQTIPALIEAHVRAGRLGLSWDDPVARAVAERAIDEAALVRSFVR